MDILFKNTRSLSGYFFCRIFVVKLLKKYDFDIIYKAVKIY